MEAVAETQLCQELCDSLLKEGDDQCLSLTNCKKNGCFSKQQMCSVLDKKLIKNLESCAKKNDPSHSSCKQLATCYVGCNDKVTKLEELCDCILSRQLMQGLETCYSSKANKQTPTTEAFTQLCNTCGNGVLDDNEYCDLSAPISSTGMHVKCRSDCSICGDGIVDKSHGEECDPPGEKCSSGCTKLRGDDDDGGEEKEDDDDKKDRGTCKKGEVMCPNYQCVRGKGSCPRCKEDRNSYACWDGSCLRSANLTSCTSKPPALDVRPTETKAVVRRDERKIIDLTGKKQKKESADEIEELSIGRVNVPPGAFVMEEVVLQVRAVAEEDAKQFVASSSGGATRLVSTIIALVLTDANDVLVDAATFAQPVTIELIATLPDEATIENVCLAFNRENEDRWVCLEDTQVISEDPLTLSANTTHFTNFAALLHSDNSGSSQRSGSSGNDRLIIIVSVVAAVVAAVVVIVGIGGGTFIRRRMQQAELKRELSTSVVHFGEHDARDDRHL
ncbi:hypothetical protein QOT17_006682 [Balamuthia mandrillaris]